MSTGLGILLSDRKLQSRSKTCGARYKQWKNIAYLKDIDAYDFGESGMISILLDFFPDEAHKEITSKHETTGHKSSTLMWDEKPETVDLDDPVGGKKIAFAGEGTHHSNDDTQCAYIWDTSVNDGYGGFIMTAKRVRDDVDEEEDRQTKHRPGAIPEASTETGKSKGKGAKGGKGKGLNPADRKCFLCGEEGHYNAPNDGTSRRVYVAVGGTAYHSCTAKEKARPTGKESRKERAPRASAKARTRATVLGCTVRSLLTCWKDATQTPKPRGRTLRTIKRTSGNTLACWERSRRSSQRRTV